MSFYVSWIGLGHEFPGLKATASLPPEGLDDPSSSHLEQVDVLIQRWADEHPDEQVQVTLSGHAQEIDTGTHSTLSLNLTTTPAPKEETPVDASKSPDPFAPDDAPDRAEQDRVDQDPQQGGPGGQTLDSLAKQEQAQNPVTAQQPADPAPVNTPEGRAAVDGAEHTEPQDASQVQAIGSAGENPADATPEGAAGPEAVRPPETAEVHDDEADTPEAHADTEAALEHPPVADPPQSEASASEPTSDSPSGIAPTESAGPTEVVSTDPAKPGELPPADKPATTDEDHDAVS